MSGTGRRRFLVSAGALFATSAVSCSQPAVAPRRVAWLTAGSPVSHARPLAAFRDGLRDHGWIEGRNVVLGLSWAEGRLERLPELVTEIVASRPDAILAAANVVVLALRKQTSTIPIVMATGADPVAAGLAQSLARPGGNVTGLTGFYERMPFKMLEVASALVARHARVALLYDKAFSTSLMRADMRQDLERSAAASGLTLRFVEVATADEALRSVSALAQDPPTALVVLPGAQIFALGARFVASAEQLRIPVVYPFEELVDAGGLMSYGPDVPDSYRRAARYVDLILRGANPGELAMEQPVRLALVVNARTARAHGIAVPAALLARADRIVD